jgi:hypothetical protein
MRETLSSGTQVVAIVRELQVLYEKEGEREREREKEGRTQKYVLRGFEMPLSESSRSSFFSPSFSPSPSLFLFPSLLHSTASLLR